MARVRRSLEDQSYSKTPKSAAGDQATTGSGRKYSVTLGRSMEVAPQSEGKAPHEQPPAWNQLLQLAMDQQSTIMDFHEETEEERAAHRAVARQAVKEICIYSLFLMFFSLRCVLPCLCGAIYSAHAAHCLATASTVPFLSYKTSPCSSLVQCCVYCTIVHGDKQNSRRPHSCRVESA